MIRALEYIGIYVELSILVSLWLGGLFANAREGE
jgi:hypothetical protein